jgi:CRISPR-associated protein Csx10
MWGLPKPLLPAIARGSVFTYSADRQDRDTVLAWLQQLEQNGVGERLQEGYGQIEVNSPFHTDKGITIQEKIK